MTKYEEANIEFNHVRISDMIKQLQAVQEQYGDIIVSVIDDCGFACFDLKANVIDINECGGELFGEDRQNAYTKAVSIDFFD